MKRYITILIAIGLVPALAMAAWLTQASTSNGVTVVTAVSAPAASTSRTVPANGGITVFNSATSNLLCTIQYADGSTTNILESFDLPSGQTFYNKWVLILDSTSDTLEILSEAGAGTQLKYTTHYRDEGQ